MTEQELVKILYDKHNKMVLNAVEASVEWGSSYSSLSKLFGGKNALPERIIREKKIIPEWTQIGSKRMWKLTDIAKWILDTEKVY